ncbi:type II secretion system F family protein [Trichlorobacter lovleyi]|uniref:type II secretion system F family protein n=1 Tax=Trichlorobacter lovleyi TaxID=313985 RepID=UPI0022409FC3|nr:type II secretion system F family protein [Trichlorobacter lovleyi]QOX79922.1 type II secretion system F family protein [Trichlorobacter lovleyi]
MTSFSYHAVDAAGRLIRGYIEAASPETASQDLTARGYYLLKLDKSSGVLARLRRNLFRQRVKRAEIIELAGNLSVMVGAGIPITISLGDLAEATTNTTLQTTLTGIKQEIEQGSTFSDAIERYDDIFPDILIRLVRVGEETGRFEKSLSDVAEHLQRMDDLASSIKRALIYPTFAIIATGGALIFWLVFVLPKIIGTIKGMGVKLPLLTRMLMATSSYTQRYWYLLPIIALCCWALFKLLKRNEKACYQIDRLKLKLPIYSLIEYNRLLALFAEQMRILIVAGLTVDRTLGIIAEVMRNLVFRHAIDSVRDDITYGSTIADALKKHPVFPLLLVRMVGIGETSGSLDDQFGFLSTHYLKKLDDISDKLGKIIEPVVIAVIGILFAIIIMGLLLPVYDLVSTVGRR